VKDEVAKVKDKVAKMTLLLKKQTKRQRLLWAIGHSDIGAFTYADAGYQLKSSELVKTVLCAFAEGHGCWILADSTAYSESDSIHTKLKAQIRTLTGKEPRIVIKEDKRGIICYE
jgi:hypothetical protein